MANARSVPSVDGAASQILSMLDEDDDAPPAPKPELEGDEGDPETDDAAEEAAESDSTPADEAEPRIDPPASWKADAKARFKALPRELQQVIADRERERESHFSRTQQEAAQARRAADAERQSLHQERQAHAQQLGSLVDALRETDPTLAEGARTDWVKLYRDDPGTAQTKWAAFQQRVQQLGAAIAHRDALHQKAREENLRQSEAHLRAKLDFWQNPEQRRAFKAAMGQFLQNAGFNEGEVNGLADARAILVARKAMLYDHLMAQQARIAAAKKAPSATRTVRSQASVDESSNGRAKALAQRAARSGRLDDQAAAILAALD